VAKKKVFKHCHQYTDKHGEVCPADWTPGSDTIIPDPKGKIKYFKSHGGKASDEL
jgi:alkyl hydroperoxide reductase subunit AhpC